MDVWSGRGSRDGRSKSQIRDPVLLQKPEQRLSFRTVGMERDVHGVAMVQSPAVVNWSLSEDGYWEFFLERISEEALYFPRFAQIPTRSSGVANERCRSYEALSRESKVLSDRFLGFSFREHRSNLRVGVRHLLLGVSNFSSRFRQGSFLLFDLSTRDQTLFVQLFLNSQLLFCPGHFSFVNDNQLGVTSFGFIRQPHKFRANLREVRSWLSRLCGLWFLPGFALG